MVSMLLSLLPVTASAADSVTVTVGAVELSDGQYTSDGVSITETPGDSYAYLKDGVLTLHNFTYEGDGKGGTTTSNPIRMLGSSADLVIALEGTNAFVMNASGSNYRCGLFCGRDLQITITSTTMGSLSLVSASANQISSGVHNYYGTVIVSGNAVVSASGTTVGIYGALTVSGGGVIAQGASGAFSKEPVLDNYSPVVKAGTDAQSAETAELGSCYKQPYVSILPAAAPDPEPETPEAPDAPAEGVGYTIDHSAEKLYAQDGYEISADHETWDKELDAAPGGTYYVRVAQSGTVPASEGTAFQLTLRPSAPAAQVAVTSNMVALEEDAAWEYSSDGVNWGSSAMFEGLREASPYTFYVRTKATEENFASEPAVISVYTAAAPPAPGT
ncbi:MAG: hypothetical protein IKJ37_06245, partial [Kiritimatiellae bacterium]|nr:hypothetical protein [Kiritimatiellia bacterium]